MPVIDDPVFLAEFKKRCKDVKNITIQTYMVCDIDGASAADRETRAEPMDCLKLIEPYVNQIDTALTGWRTDARFTVAQGNCATLAGPLGKKSPAYNVVKNAFDVAPRRKLVGFFASLIVPFAAIWVRHSVVAARAGRVADAGANPLLGQPAHAAVRAAIYGNAMNPVPGFKRYHASGIASQAAISAGVTPAVEQAIDGSSAAARTAVETGTSPATASGDAAVAAALGVDPTLTVNIQAVIRATANAVMTEPPISYAVTPPVVTAFNLLPAATMVKTGIARARPFSATIWNRFACGCWPIGKISIIFSFRDWS